MILDLRNEDCISGMEKIENASVDVFITSPPYNIGTKYNSCDDALTEEEYLKFTYKYGEQIKRLMAADGSFFLNIGSKPTNPLLPHKVLIVLSQLFTLQNEIHWVKSITVNDKSAGHFKPINSQRFLNETHEYIWHFTHKGDVAIDRLAIGVPYTDESNVRRWASKSPVRCRGNNWFLPYSTTNKKKSHPATFPLSLPLNCLKLCGDLSNKKVLDCFMGTGTTGLAANIVGAKEFVGFEMDRGYFDIAASTLTEATNSNKLV